MAAPQGFRGVAVVEALQLQEHVVAPARGSASIAQRAHKPSPRLAVAPRSSSSKAVRVVGEVAELDLAPDALGPDDLAHQQMRIASYKTFCLKRARTGSLLRATGAR